MPKKELKRSSIGRDLRDLAQASSLSDRGKQSAISLIEKYGGISAPGGGVFALNNNKTLTAVCAAGLGNRICTLIGGLFWSQKLNYKFQIYWDLDTCCSCKYDSLFNSHLDDLIQKNSFYGFFINNIMLQAGVYPEKHKTNIDNILICDAENYNNLNNNLASYNTIFFNEGRVHSYISDSDITNLLSQFKIKQSILDVVNDYIFNNNISKEVVGMHIRKIDPPEIESGRFFIPVEHYLNIIQSNKDKSFFICSDSKEIEEIFLKYPNVKMFSKTVYAEYSAESNITHRNEQSVIEGLIDMLILSRTDILPLSVNLSSFCKSASYFSNVAF